jgi:hypothetical protein
MKNRKHIRFYNKRVIPYMFGMRINKDNKVTKTIRKNIGARPQTSLNIKLNGAVVYDP